MQIGKTLYLSTLHIGTKTANKLNACAFRHDKLPNGATVHSKGVCGWFVEVLNNIDQLPDDISSCMRIAQNEHCDWIMFDRDIEPIDLLDLHKW